MISEKYRDLGISPVIGVILLVAVTVALIALASIVVFNISGDGETSADASIDFSQTSDGVSVQVISNNNVDEFRVLFPDGTEQTLSGSVGSSLNLIGPEGTYSVVAVMNDGTEEVLATQSVSGLDYSGVFIVLQDEEEGEVEATLSQEFDNVEDYDLELEENDEGDEEVTLQSFEYESGHTLLSDQLVNEDNTLTRGERVSLMRITSNLGVDTVNMESFDGEETIESDVAYVGETIQVHELTNLCPGDELILTESETNDDLASEEITVDNDCGELRKVARYLNGEITAAEIINLWNLELDYFVFQYDGQPQPELPTSPVPEDEDGIDVRATVLNETDGSPIEGATVALGDRRQTTNSDGNTTFTNVDPGVELANTEGNNIDAVAYRNGYKPSPVRTIPVDADWNDPQEEEFMLEPYQSETPTRDSGSVPTGGSSVYNFDGSYSGGGSVISGNGGGGSFTGSTTGGGTFYSSGGATPTTFSQTTPVSQPDYEFVQPERIFNVIDIDEELIPTNEEFLVRTSLRTNGEQTVDDTVRVYAINKSDTTSDISVEDEIGSSDVTLVPGETTTNEQKLTIDTVGEYDVYVYLEGSDSYKSAGSLDVFDNARENAIIDGGEIDPTNANTDEEVTVTITGEDITVGDDVASEDTPDTVTVDIFKNGIRVTEGEVNLGDAGTTVTYTEEFANPQYVQFHAGIQESQDVAILGTSVITESAVGGDLMTAFDTQAMITNPSEDCVIEDVRTSGQFDCEVETEHDTPIEFNATNTNIDFGDLTVDDVDSIEFRWVFNSTNTESVEFTDDTPVEDFITDANNDNLSNYDIFTEDNVFVEDTVHMVEFRASVVINGEDYGARDALFVNALDDPNYNPTRITGTTTNENVLDVNVMNPRETITEDVEVEFVSKENYEADGNNDITNIDPEYILDDSVELTMRPEESKLITKEFSSAELEELSASDNIEGGDTIEIWTRLKHVEQDEAGSADDSFFAVVELTVPEASMDATIEGSVEICESDC